MAQEVHFMIFCLEEYRYAKNLTGKQVVELFNKYSICEYLKEYYEALHTTGVKYIINDIDTFIKTSQVV